MQKLKLLFFVSFSLVLSTMLFAQEMSYNEKAAEKKDADNASIYIQPQNGAGHLNGIEAQIVEDFESGLWPPAGWSEYHTGVENG